MNSNDLIVIVDDEQEITNSYEILLKKKGYKNFRLYNSSVDFLDELGGEEPAVLFLDIRMPHMNGEEVLAEIKSRGMLSSVYIISGTEDVATAVRCIQNGALDYIVKPIDKDRFHTNLMKGLEFYKVKTELSSIKKDMENSFCFTNPAFQKVVTRSRNIEDILKYISNVAVGDAPILITGETGTGKDLMAEAVHISSGRAGRFIPVNISAFDEHLFNDTLFGHVKGAFTGADKHRPGVLANADNGTVFLDEIGDLDESSQIKLLRLLQNKEYFPVGADAPSSTNARIVAATHADLKAKVEAGTFRQDLYYRLSSHMVSLPPLRDRQDDIDLLIYHFYNSYMAKMGMEYRDVSDEFITAMLHHDFPGNVRELQAVVQDYVMLFKGKSISKPELKKFLASHHIGMDSADSVRNTYFKYEGHFPTLKEMETFLVKEAISRTNGNQSKAASLLGISRQAMNKRLNG
jgi:DNA-binding NtrC family response regulator